jgi:hypothetical protein
MDLLGWKEGGKVMKARLKLIGIALVVVAVLAIGISWDVYRWKTFQEETHSEISYLKWKFVIEDGSSGGRK